jgi:hypothetical protein
MDKTYHVRMANVKARIAGFADAEALRDHAPGDVEARRPLITDVIWRGAA